MVIRVLDKKIKKRDYILLQVERERNKAIYAQIFNGHTEPIAFEVIKIREVKIGKFLEKSDKYKGFDLLEKYPSSEDFGRYGWSFGGIDKYERAIKFYNTL